MTTDNIYFFKTLALRLLILASGTFLAPYSFGQNWKPVEGHIFTKWTEKVDPENVLPEYPRPQMTRKEWQSLNGLWNYAILPRDETAPTNFQGKILVPYPVESALSGVKKEVGKDFRIWYQRTFEIPVQWRQRRILMHFGAVDWESVVYINGREAFTHQGGYDPFFIDITDHLNETSVQQVSVAVWDPTSEGPQPRGKQVINPEGIWYTPVTGIWQTVWLEPVAESSIASFKYYPDIDKGTVRIKIDTKGVMEGIKVKISARDQNNEVGADLKNPGETHQISIKNPKLWSPESPFLYSTKIQLIKNGKVIDEVDSYFGMRKISLQKDASGVQRIMLNNKFLFQYGTLDQGWWPDGLYTAPTDEAMLMDIDITKKLGFNMIRKHVKVEPARWYYHCDRLGILVWQDMPNGDETAPWESPSGIDGKEMVRTGESEAIFKKELNAMINTHFNSPALVMWVPFNEGWGQFKTVEIIKWVMKLDPTRLVNGPSGGNHFVVGHTIDHHQYPGPAMPPRRENQALVLGEFGGLGLPMEGHLWQKEKNWGYRKYQSIVELTQAYNELVNQIPELIKNGLSAAIYTQTTDVEGEVNGLMTYDRKIIKFDPIRLNRVHKSLFFQLEEEKALSPATN